MQCTGTTVIKMPQHSYTGVPEAYKIMEPIPKILLTSGDLKSRFYIGSMVKIGYSIQGDRLVAKVMDIVANG